MAQITGQSSAREADPANELLRCFGRQMKILRERAGLTQAALAQQLGYSEAQIAAIEQGRRIPRPETIDRLDSLLDGNGLLIAMKRAVALTRYPAFFRDAARIEEEAVEFHAYAPCGGLDGVRTRSRRWWRRGWPATRSTRGSPRRR